ncbi:HDOD domain-containing protein [Ideonella margarita]|uniref:HDOD domain-containing protein n=1 Tax=Ideonella margarita TaxID=2984191 RepID=A0ABU9C1D9_9BURK
MSATPSIPTAPRRMPLDVAGWVRYFQLVEIPVLAQTAGELEDMRANEDAVDARMIGEVVSADPLMTLKLLAHTSSLHRVGRLNSDVETVTEGLVLMGITPFFNTFGPQPTVQQHLEEQPAALAGLMSVVQRSHRAAKFALGFAAHRLDPDVAVIYEAALLYDFTEMLLWLHAPALALEIQQRQLNDPSLRSVTAQRDVLNVTLQDIQQSLLRSWRLPELLLRITDERHQEATQVRNVLLAIRLARHSAKGWDNPALPDDITDLSHLLNMAPAHVQRLVTDLDA